MAGRKFISLWAFVAAISCISAASPPLRAQSLNETIPARRVVIYQNTDFFGSDLRNIFETSYANCESVCLADAACQAFTFNTKSNACFPKSAVEKTEPFEGAISALIKDTAAEVLEQAQARRSNLEFLAESWVERAHKHAQSNGWHYPVNGWSAQELRSLSARRETEGNFERAMQLQAAAVNIDDAAEGWIEISRLAQSVKTNDSSKNRTHREIAILSAINGFLRAGPPATQATALQELARAFEADRKGPDAIPVLRLSQSLAPRQENITALDRLIPLYGFRVVEHQIDNNAAAPRICLEFSEALVKAGVDYSPYVKTDAPNLAVEASGAKLCIEGVEHGARYQLTLRKGLPAASGEALHKSVDLNIYIRDRDPSVRFLGRSYVLPKTAGASIPLVTVNLDQVDVKIYRIGDRNLQNTVQDEVFNQPLGKWDIDRIRNSSGEEVWQGSGEVSNELNRDMTNALPIGAAIGDFEPGVYVMTAAVPGSDQSDGNTAAQWFVVTDIGLASLTGNDGLHVFVRSLADASVSEAVSVQLLARNNEVLGEAQSDTQGYVHFPAGLTRGTGGNAPAMIIARDSKGDFAFLRQDEAGFDLSDRGVEGRRAAPPVDVFLATDRGVYRPGESIHATFLARDHQAKALIDLPLTAVLLRPDGVEHSRVTMADLGAGGHVQSFALPKGAQRGTWRLRAFLDMKSPALTETALLVEDFIPERIDFDLTLPEPPISLGDNPQISVAAKFLYGAPGADLPIEGEIRVSARDNLADYPGYKFGLIEEVFSPRLQSLPEGFTDELGSASLQMKMPEIAETTKPLELRATVRLRDGSARPVERSLTRPIAPSSPMLGIKPLFDGILSEGALARFEVIAVGADGARSAMPKIGWTLNRIHTTYQWYEVYGRWNYEPITSKERIATGEIEVLADALATVEAAVDWGQYELKLVSQSGAYAASSYRFSAGWYAPADSVNTPDTLEIGLDKSLYQPGDTAQVRLVPRYTGKALITVMSDRLIAMKAVDVVQGENLIDMDVTEEWGAGAYVSATVIRPMDVNAGHNPARAMGLNWAKVDPGDKLLKAEFISSAMSDPRGALQARMKIEGISPGQSAFATIAAVDIGILNLTDFTPPAPDEHYFGQRKLGIAIRDIYGRLIDGMQGNQGHLRSGGDATANRNLNSPPASEELVAYHSGMLIADAQGYVQASFDIPDFNGTVRLMAVVWSDSSVGQATQDVLVRDPVVVGASMPRFLAPGDKSRLLLELAHTQGPTGEFTLEVTNASGIPLVQSVAPQRITLGDQERTDIEVPLQAGAMGTGQILVNLTTPDGKVLSKSLHLPVRANDPEIARQTYLEMAAGQELTLQNDVFAGLQPGSARASFAIGPLAQFDAPALLSALDRYPYGCTEQITSKAMPLLYFDQVSDALGHSQKTPVKTRIAQAITGVLANQSSRGSFGVWRPDSGDLWLDAYVTDFLSRAKMQGHTVPDIAFTQALDNLRNRVDYASDFEKGGEDVAYALMVMAREGYANIGDLRYYADARAGNFATQLALAQLGTALASYGDQTRADRLFTLAGTGLHTPEKTLGWRSDYGSRLRDSAAILTLASESGSAVIDQQALTRIITAEPLANQSPQENMWSLMAANALIDSSAANEFLLNGQPITGPLVHAFGDQLTNGETMVFHNGSNRQVNTVLTTYGIPIEPEPAAGNGYKIERKYFALEGHEISPAHIAQNTQLIVVLKVTPVRDSEARLMINDPLPAGLEIDNPNLLQSRDLSALEWLDLNVEVENAEFRDDRFLAAVNWRGKSPFQLAYLVRAISPGVFHHPAASVEDMYRPAFRARTDTGVVEVLEN